MRIAHFPQNPANHAYRLAVAQRKLGHEVVVYGRKKADATYGYTSDIYIEGRLDPFHFNLDMFRRRKELNSFDIIHNHCGIWKTQLAYYLVRKPKLFLEYHGQDAREGIAVYHQRLASGFFYSTPDLRKKVPPESQWLPHPIELLSLPPKPGNKKPLFVHFTSTEKGASKFIASFDKAFGPLNQVFNHDRSEQRFAGKDAELRIYHQITQAEVFDIMRQADVVLDQWRGFGIYGFLAVEAMAYGKPVVADIDWTLYPSYCPVLTPSHQMLQKLAEDETWRRHIGDMGRVYVERVHEASMVAKQSIAAFERALSLK